MRHIDMENRTHFVSNSTEAGEIDDARISGATGDDDFRPMFLCKTLNFVEIDQVRFRIYTKLHSVEPFAGHCGLCPVRKVAAGIKAHTQNCITRFDQSEHDSAIGLCPGMWLHIGKASVEQRLSPFNGKRFNFVRRRATLVITLARIAFSIFVCEHRTLRFKHRFRNNVFRRD